MKFVFATNNQHKVKEIKAVLPATITVITLKEAGIDIDIPEPHNTLEANAFEKARTIYKITQTNCFSEDTGLEVTALNGEPGVFSARYAGEESTSEKNIAKLLNNLAQQQNRSAQFRTVVALILNNKEYYFEGICKGLITTAPAGDGGFGYDAVFVPEGAAKTFAQMSLDEKNQYSHRRKATDKLVTFLNNSLINEQI
jgi:XTP/dITP diphosphohydrolase